MGSAPSQGQRRTQRTSYKVVLMGDAGCGKTNVFLRYCRNQFDFRYRPTAAVTIGSKIYNIPDSGDHVGVQMWDLPGQETNELRQRYYRDLDAAIVVVDSTSTASIDAAIGWYKDVTESVARLRQASSEGTAITDGPEPGSGMSSAGPTEASDSALSACVPVLLMGTKHDLLDANEATTSAAERRQGEDLLAKFNAVGEETGFIGHVLVSAKSGDNSVYSAVNFLLHYLWSPVKATDQLNATSDSTDSAGVGIRTKIVLTPKDALKQSGLRAIGDAQVDRQLESSATAIVQIMSMQAEWQRARKQFCRTCRMLPKSGGAACTSVEQGCQLMKNAVEETDLKLTFSREENGFVKLLRVDGGQSTIAAVSIATTAYESQVFRAALRILRECPAHCTLLASAQCSLRDEYTAAQGKDGNSKKTKHAAWKLNIGMVTDAQELGELLMKDVHATADRIQARLSW